jgi:hypothetical protein
MFCPDKERAALGIDCPANKPAIISGDVCLVVEIGDQVYRAASPIASPRLELDYVAAAVSGIIY